MFDTNTWTRTTGLFENDWVGAFVNPMYERGKYVGTEVGYLMSDLYLDELGRVQGGIGPDIIVPEADGGPDVSAPHRFRAPGMSA